MKSNVFGLAICVLSASLSELAAAPWPVDTWNPVAMPDDIVLPLPCDGQMVFRRVVTHRVVRGANEDLLSDQPVQLGRGDTSYGFVDQLREEHLAGPFTTSAGDRFFLIGKYELTANQYEAVMQGSAGTCPPTPAAGSADPKVDVSWYDAIEFTRRLNSWLYGKSTQSLPKIGTAFGYVRLPTEVEWEFAARGGLAVSDADRIAEADTLKPSLADHAWFTGSMTENRVRRIGRKKANPIGLFDMLGNAEEIMLDPFQMNKVGRRHGQYGGLVTRGGSIRNTEDAIRFSQREELPIFDPRTRAETRRPTIGMRVVIGANAIHGDDEIDRLNKEYQSTSRQTVGTTGSIQPLHEMEELLKKQTDESSLRMKRLTEELRAEFRRRNELELKATMSVFREAVRNFASIESRANSARANDDILRGLTSGAAPGTSAPLQDADRAEIESYGKDLARDVSQLLSLAAIYRENLYTLAFEFSDRSSEAVGKVTAYYEAQRRTEDVRRIRQIVRQIEEYKQNRLSTEKDTLRSAVGEGAWTR